MPRIKNYVAIPQGVSCALIDSSVSFAGPKGDFEVVFPPEVSVENRDGGLWIDCSNPAMVGTFCSHMKNAVIGVTSGFLGVMKLVGTGFRVEYKNDLILKVGFSHLVNMAVPSDVTVSCPDPNTINVSGVDKHAVFQFCANLRRIRPPNVYDGKGIHLVGSFVVRKERKKK